MLKANFIRVNDLLLLLFHMLPHGVETVLLALLYLLHLPAELYPGAVKTGKVLKEGAQTGTVMKNHSLVWLENIFLRL